MAEQLFLTTGEFQRSMAALQRTITGRCDMIDTKLDNHLERISSLETKIDDRGKVEKRQTRNSASGWSAIVASAVIGVVEVIKLWAK